MADLFVEATVGDSAAEEDPVPDATNAFENLGPIALAARASAAKVAANPVLAGGSAGLTGGKRATARADDGGLGVVRIKPLGAGGGGGERSAAYGPASAVTFSTNPPSITVDGRLFEYPSHIITPDMDNQALFDAFMPKRIDAFLAGVNVNVMAYGQTGSGKTHTMFGPAGVMARAASGEYGDGVYEGYGLFPRGLLAIFAAVDERRRAGETLVLTGSAVEVRPDTHTHTHTRHAPSHCLL